MVYYLTGKVSEGSYSDPYFWSKNVQMFEACETHHLFSDRVVCRFQVG